MQYDLKWFTFIKPIQIVINTFYFNKGHPISWEIGHPLVEWLHHLQVVESKMGSLISIIGIHKALVKLSTRAQQTSKGFNSINVVIQTTMIMFDFHSPLYRLYCQHWSRFFSATISLASCPIRFVLTFSQSIVLW